MKDLHANPGRICTWFWSNYRRILVDRICAMLPELNEFFENKYKHVMEAAMAR